MSSLVAREHLLKHESYFSLELPPYFVFDGLLNKVNQILDGKNLSDFCLTKNCSKAYENVNYKMFNNKDGKYAWRPFQIMHPAIYVSLVQKITGQSNWEIIKERFRDFSKNKRIECVSVPRVSLNLGKDKAKQITYWWQKVEQKSIELALDYEYLFQTDITDCYGSIYTHSISWALHGNVAAKKKINDKSLLGNAIDNHIMNMCHGQTNSLPQGSILMDLIAEMVLGYADMELSNRLENQYTNSYKILRYRDDYRIFCNNPQIGDKITKALTEVLIDLGLRLNTEKTKVCNSVIKESIKEDKLAWMMRKKCGKNIQKQLLIIHDHSIKFPNSGSLIKVLNEFLQRIAKIKRNNQILPLISIVTDIAFRNPNTYSMCAAILSKFFGLLPGEKEKMDCIHRIIKKFSKIPNIGYMDIWLQRATIGYKKDLEFEEPLCNLVKGNNEIIWNNDWINCQLLRDIIDGKNILDFNIINTINPVIPPKEVELYASKYITYN